LLFMVFGVMQETVLLPDTAVALDGGPELRSELLIHPSYACREAGGNVNST
jgi:hypothetical protein